MGKGRRYDQDYKDMIVDLFKSGMSVSEISNEYGIAKSTGLTPLYWTKSI